MLQGINESTVEDTLYKMKQEKAKAKAKKDAPKWTWSFGIGCYIDICKDGIACVHFGFDCKLKFRIAWSAGYFSNDDWEHAIKCLREAKDILKKIRKI